VNRFLITGLPRIRSAWFTALLNAHGAPTKHELLPTEALEQYAGRCDPSAACLYPKRALPFYEGHPVVIIERDPACAKGALARWAGIPSEDFTNWHSIFANYEYFCAESPKALRVHYNALNSYANVSAIVEYTTGRRLDQGLFETFDMLQIEQHVAKARAIHAVSR
jgi:hypothetical protein